MNILQVIPFLPRVYNKTEHAFFYDHEFIKSANHPPGEWLFCKSHQFIQPNNTTPADAILLWMMFAQSFIQPRSREYIVGSSSSIIVLGMCTMDFIKL